MPFELNIAVKHDPAEQSRDREGLSQHVPCPVTVVEVTGELSPETSVELTQRLESVVSAAASSVILRFAGDLQLSQDDLRSIEILAGWVKRCRRDRCSLYVDVPQVQARDAFMRVDEMKSVMLPLGADASVPRRVVADQPSKGDG